MTLSPPLLHRATISGLFLMLSLAVSALAQPAQRAPESALVTALDAGGCFSTLADETMDTSNGDDASTDDATDDGA